MQPLWTYFLAAGAALFAAGLGFAVSWSTSRRQAQWTKRAESLVHLRWATELALSADRAVARAGAAAITTLIGSDLLAEADYTLAHELLHQVYVRQTQTERKQP